MSDELSIDELERRMRPGAYSTGGFLGPNESLEAVIARDGAALAALGVTHAQAADALEAVLGEVLATRDQFLGLQKPKPSKAIGQPDSAGIDYKRFDRVERTEDLFPGLYRPQLPRAYAAAHLPPGDRGYRIGERLQVFIVMYRGWQECPWEGDFQWGTFDFLLLNRATGEYVTGPGLIVHLIRAHRFFEGVESPYRVDPARLARVLELAPKAG